MFSQHHKLFLSVEYLFIDHTSEEFFSGRLDNDSAQVRTSHQYARPAFRCGPVTESRPHTLHLICSVPSSKLTEDCFPTCDCECKRLWLQQYTPHLWKNLATSTRYRVHPMFGLFSPLLYLILNSRMKQSTLSRDFLSTRWKAAVLGVLKALNLLNEALIKFLELFVTHSWQWSFKLEDRGLSEMEPQAGNNRSPLKRTPENGPNKPCSKHCVQVSLFALDEGVENGSLFHLIGDIIHKALQIDLEISFGKFYAC